MHQSFKNTDNVFKWDFILTLLSRGMFFHILLTFQYFLQLNISMRRITDKCGLIHESGVVTDGNVDRRIDFHFNAMLDIVADWRKNHSDDNDYSLLG